MGRPRPARDGQPSESSELNCDIDLAALKASRCAHAPIDGHQSSDHAADGLDHDHDLVAELLDHDRRDIEAKKRCNEWHNR